jgi:hypothetical protein
MRSVILVLSIATATCGVAAEAAPEQKVAVRTFNYADVPHGELAAAKSEAAHIFHNAGISIEWIDCWVPGANGGALCTEPLITGRDLMLRLVDRRPAVGDRIVALGESMLDGEQRGGVLMTVDMFPVRSVAAGASTPVSTLLGRAVAHEIGHLLLGSRKHPRLGLMRALWTHDELRGLKPAHWGFTPREVARMRQGLRGKSRPAD